jgi:drug/metabolite transporter (DMT)-like permease
MEATYGLVAALSFGTADFMVAQATRKTGVLKAFFFIQLLGLLAIGAVVALVQAAPASPSVVWGWLALAAAVNFAGTLLLYRSFAIGTLAIVSPISSGFAVVTAVLALLSGERPPVLILAGATLLMVGVAVVTRGSGGGSGQIASRAGVPEALGAALCLGAYFWALDSITPTLGWAWPVLVTRVVQLLLAVLLLVGRGDLPRLPIDGTRTFLLAAAGLDTVALVAFSLGLEAAYTTATTALTSLYSVVAALLAWIFLRERLSGRQWAGVGVLLVGVLLVAL